MGHARALTTGGSALALAALSAAAFGSRAVSRTDAELLVRARIALHPRLSVRAARRITRVGHPKRFAVLAATTVTLAGLSPSRTAAPRAATALTGATLTTQLLQELLRTQRDVGGSELRVYEYPSGHTTGMAAVALILTSIAAPRWRFPAAGAGAGASGALVAALAVTDSHLPSDVLAGALVAAGWAAALGFPAAGQAGHRGRGTSWRC